MPLIVDLRIEDEAWQTGCPNLETFCQRALEAAFANTANTAHVDVLLTDDVTLARLNTDWRNKEGPTDVLSFPAEENPAGFLGDIAIAYGISLRDAEAGGKSLPDHLAHLLIHGMLHLCGYDHVNDEEAEIMESLERAALSTLGIADPYSRIVQK